MLRGPRRVAGRVGDATTRVKHRRAARRGREGVLRRRRRARALRGLQGGRARPARLLRDRVRARLPHPHLSEADRRGDGRHRDGRRHGHRAGRARCASSASARAWRCPRPRSASFPTWAAATSCRARRASSAPTSASSGPTHPRGRRDLRRPRRRVLPAGAIATLDAELERCAQRRSARRDRDSPALGSQPPEPPSWNRSARDRLAFRPARRGRIVASLRPRRTRRDWREDARSARQALAHDARRHARAARAAARRMTLADVLPHGAGPDPGVASSTATSSRASARSSSTRTTRRAGIRRASPRSTPAAVDAVLRAALERSAASPRPPRRGTA